ncbi:DUF1707 SHOCT-like domain-containing protein [Nocardia sp. CDC160]|uniref:DUF1707 SHOCT-like domain-containing protein n=1 Tax=Nocardia sp. CDC160 TaxID=3112166 RepID=UPI002DBC0E91|nr:DUF1707 domain-containing protein [Nocardia sp. CDC160]MEC3920235.1 DUF1707 domain-containing protein [Nocardia sp. CDC160]
MDGPRISTADRERALRELSQHFGNGRLTLTEFEDRSAAVTTATSLNQLAQLFIDLPVNTPGPSQIPAEPTVSPLAVVITFLTIAATALFAATGNPLSLLLVAAAVLILLIRRTR